MPTELIVRMVLSAILLLVIIIILSKFRESKSKTNAKDSLSILKERLDRGEISKEDYHKAKKRQGK